MYGFSTHVIDSYSWHATGSFLQLVIDPGPMRIDDSSSDVMNRGLPALIAVVGCDGSGKSTVTELLESWLSRVQPTRVCHLGKQSGNIGRSIGRLPLLGSRLEKFLFKKAKTAQTSTGPGWATALGVYVFTLRRVRRFQQMMKLRRQGHIIIADRFPQVEVPGPMDGPGLGNARPTGIVGWLARRERRDFAQMVANKPDLVIRLNVSLPVAIARKPDHRPDALKRKISDLAQITFAGAPVAEINADEPLEVVLTNVKAAISAMLKERYGIDVPLPSAASAS